MVVSGCDHYALFSATAPPLENGKSFTIQALLNPQLLMTPNQVNPLKFQIKELQKSDDQRPTGNNG